jgi:hypothetical protein
VLFVTIGLFSLSVGWPSTVVYGQVMQTSPYGAVGPVLISFNGELRPEVRAAYLNWATNFVMGELRRYHQSVPDDCLAEVQADPDLSDAMFRSVYPPDPSILQNYARLRSELGDAFMAKYRSLVMATAVAKRINGTEVGLYGTTWIGKPIEDEGGARDAEGNYQPGFWTDESLQPVGTPAEKDYVAAIADFMKTNQVAALDLYQSAARQAQLVAFLKERNISPSLIMEVKQSVPFGERLKNAMVLLGQRPSARGAKPDDVHWLRYLTSIYEATPGSTPTVDGRPMSWPIFPIDRAPWPLLMPLARPVPLDEAQYIWETFQGEHGPDRYETYGPYRGDSDVMPYELQPSQWFWDAWPDRIRHGGECVPLSKATVDLYSCLARPAVWAGQPGHANLISFQGNQGNWGAQVEQAFAGGPDVTYAQWYFDDRYGTELRFRSLYNWAGAEYHFGLALGMNRGLQSYLDTRMAAYLFGILPGYERSTTGRKLLESAAAANPFNPDIWYQLALLTRDSYEGMAFIGSVMKQAPDGLGYWQTVDEFVAHCAILDRPPPRRESDLVRVCALLQTVPGVKPDDIKSYTGKFYQGLADQGGAYGQLQMGKRYLDGVGVPRDENRARDYFSEAVAQGNADAVRELEVLDATVPESDITVSASSQYSPDQDIKHLIDGSGMCSGLHDNNYAADTMWQSAEHPRPAPPDQGLAPSPAWVRFDFNQPEKLYSILIWNHNQLNLTDRDFRKTHIYGTSDGATWFSLTLTDTIDLPRARGDAGLPAFTVATTAGGRPVKSVIIAADAVDGNYGSDCFGLSAVRFMSRP